MAVFQWTDDYRTGLEAVDQQHRRLVAMLNDLDEARAIGSDSRVVLELLDGLAAYAQYHFATEERLMGAPGFEPRELERHRGEHLAFVEKVADVQLQAQRDPGVVGDALVDFLVHWLSEHILGTDKRMAALLNEQAPDIDVNTPVGPDPATEALVQALRESESRFRGLADSVPALIWMSDAKGVRTYFNLQWSEYTGLSRDRLLQGAWLEYVHPEDAERINQMHVDMETKTEELVAEYRLRRADRRYRWVWETTVPRFHADGGFAGQVSCAFDITERHQVEKLLRSAKQRLESMVAERTSELSKANRVLHQRYREQQVLTRRLQETQAQLLHSEKMAGIGQLAAGVAHEINNPIGYVHSNLSTLKTYTHDLLGLVDLYAGLEPQLPLKAEQRERLQRAREELDLEFLREDMPGLVEESLEGAMRAKQIVQNLKDYARIDHQESAPFDLEAGLEATIELAGKEIEPKARVIRQFAGLDPQVCVGAELNQVFMILLTNAVQAMEGPGTITLRTGRDGAAWVWVEVEDDGRGIAEQHLGRLFEPFFTTRPVGEGTGLGLSLAYGIVNQQGGRIDVESRLGEGSRFRIWLPVTA